MCNKDNKKRTKETIKALSYDKRTLSFKVFGHEYAYLYIIMIMMGFLGYAAENIGRIISYGVLDARFQRLPFIFAYGLAILALFMVFGTPNEMRIWNIKLFSEDKKKTRAHITYFLILFFSVFIVEGLFGWIFELRTGKSLWNYSELFLHLGKYTSVPTSFLYGGGAYLIMNYIFTPLLNLIERKMSLYTARVIDSTIGVVIFADFIVTTFMIIILGEAPMLWSIQLFTR